VPTFKLTLAYDGTDFVGWQRQAAGVSIQGLLEDACRELDGREVPVTGAGRTDAGVHALGQVAGASIVRRMRAASLVSAINARLPDSVRVVDASEVAGTFQPRFHARSKTYRYRIWNRDVLSPFERRYAWHLPAPELDVEAMAAAASLLEGRHDFASMQSVGSDVGSTERTVFSSRIIEAGDPSPEAWSTAWQPWKDWPPGFIVYEVSGDGFLRHMVRTIVGTLAEVGRGRHPVAWVRDVLDAKNRSRAGPTAPAEGLFLVRVDYP